MSAYFEELDYRHWRLWEAKEYWDERGGIALKEKPSDVFKRQIYPSFQEDHSALALVDAGLAALIIAALALTMVVGVQAFDALAVHGGGKPVLPLVTLFTGIATHATAPEYWWLYALLLSTTIPSLVNLIIGGASLLRGIPFINSLLLRRMLPIAMLVPSA